MNVVARSYHEDATITAVAVVLAAGIFSALGVEASTLEQVKARGKIVAGVRYNSPPFSPWIRQETSSALTLTSSKRWQSGSALA